MDHELVAAAEACQPEVVRLRRQIHANPELGNHLPETTAAVMDAISDLDLGIRHSHRTTSLIATLHGTGARGNPDRRILLRGDMDALPMPEDND
ncbi:MAG: amidohydrolase, partial [Proteobacteria bacterium]|nr:amidohydrolase [Pseudomonadota bacterium]